MSRLRRASSLCTLAPAPESAQAKRRRVLAGVVSKAFESKFGSAGPHAVALRVADFLNKKERAPVISVTLTLREGEFEPLIVTDQWLRVLRARGCLDIYAYKYVGHNADRVGNWYWRHSSDQKARKRAAGRELVVVGGGESELNAA